MPESCCREMLQQFPTNHDARQYGKYEKSRILRGCLFFPTSQTRLPDQLHPPDEESHRIPASGESSGSETGGRKFQVIPQTG
jgi:hypothetical protein